MYLDFLFESSILHLAYPNYYNYNGTLPLCELSTKCCLKWPRWTGVIHILDALKNVRNEDDYCH